MAVWAVFVFFTVCTCYVQSAQNVPRRSRETRQMEPHSYRSTVSMDHRPSILIDYDMNMKAYKDVVVNRCYVERLILGSDNRRDSHKATGRREEIVGIDLSKYEFLSKAGLRIVNFCNRMTVYLREYDFPEQEKDKHIFQNEIPDNDNALRKASLANRRKRHSSANGYVRNKRYRGQTQTQYVAYNKDGTVDKTGSGTAEAVAQPDLSRATVSGTNGMGQAQSQSGVGGCEDCYPGGYTTYPGGVVGTAPGVGGPQSVQLAGQPGGTVFPGTGVGGARETGGPSLLSGPPYPGIQRGPLGAASIYPAGQSGTAAIGRPEGVPSGAGGQRPEVGGPGYAGLGIPGGVLSRYPSAGVPGGVLGGQTYPTTSGAQPVGGPGVAGIPTGMGAPGFISAGPSAGHPLYTGVGVPTGVAGVSGYPIIGGAPGITPAGFRGTVSTGPSGIPVGITGQIPYGAPGTTGGIPYGAPGVVPGTPGGIPYGGPGGVPGTPGGIPYGGPGGVPGTPGGIPYGAPGGVPGTPGGIPYGAPGGVSGTPGEIPYGAPGGVSGTPGGIPYGAPGTPGAIPYGAPGGVPGTPGGIPYGAPGTPGGIPYGAPGGVPGTPAGIPYVAPGGVPGTPGGIQYVGPVGIPAGTTGGMPGGIPVGTPSGIPLVTQGGIQGAAPGGTPVGAPGQIPVGAQGGIQYGVPGQIGAPSTSQNGVPGTVPLGAPGSPVPVGGPIQVGTPGISPAGVPGYQGYPGSLTIGAGQPIYGIQSSGFPGVAGGLPDTRPSIYPGLTGGPGTYPGVAAGTPSLAAGQIPAGGVIPGVSGQVGYLVPGGTGVPGYLQYPISGPQTLTSGAPAGGYPGALQYPGGTGVGTGTGTGLGVGAGTGTGTGLAAGTGLGVGTGIGAGTGTGLGYGVVGTGTGIAEAGVIGGEGESQAQSNIQYEGKETKAGASSQGKLRDGVAQAQVSGTYSGTGKFSAQAQTSDSQRGAQSQIEGTDEGATSKAQGRAGRSQSQAQIQLGSGTGTTLAESQSIGINFGTNTQVQAGTKGGLADAQSKGPGSTSSQAQIGFTPYQRGSSPDIGTPFKGGGTATAQGTALTGQSQSQIQGSYRYGIIYSGAAQAGSGTPGLTFPKLTLNNGSRFYNFTALNSKPASNAQTSETSRGNVAPHSSSSWQQGNNNKEPEIPPPDPLTLPGQNENEGNYPSPGDANQYSESESQRSSNFNYTLGNLPQPAGSNNDQQTLDKQEEEDEYDDEDYEDEEEPSPPPSASNSMLLPRSGSHTTIRPTVVPTRSVYSPSQTQQVILGSNTQHGAQVIRDSEGTVTPGEVLQPGQYVPGSGGYTIPSGFRGRVKSVAGDKTEATATGGGQAQTQTVLLTPGSGNITYIDKSGSKQEVVGRESYYNRRYTYPSSSRSYYYGRNGDYDYRNRYNTRSLLPNNNYNNNYNGNNRNYDSFVTVTKSETGELNGDKADEKKKITHTYYTKSSTCGYFTFSCNIVHGSNGRTKICRPNPPTNADGTPCGQY